MPNLGIKVAFPPAKLYGERGWLVSCPAVTNPESGLVNNCDFLGSAESSCLENMTPQMKSLIYSKSRGSPW